ncbi:MAG: MFS transporter [Acidobacteria bacterium]|nr:MFS transporter [Acidobacteriota bacterium]
MVILLLIFFLGTSDNQMISPLLPLMSSEFNIGAGQIGGKLGPAYALAAAFAALFIGPLSDNFGRHRFLLYAAILFGVSLLAVFFVKDADTLALIRLFTGLAAGTFSTCSVAYVGDYFPYEKRGTAMSIVQSGYFFALALGIPVATLVAQAQGWRASFAWFGGLSLVVFFLIFLLLPDDKHLMAHHTSASARRFDNVKIAFANGERIASILAAFCVSCGFVGFLFYLGTWLVKSLHQEPRTVGFIFIAVGVVSLISAFIAGPVADKYGKRRLSIFSTLVLALMLFIIPKFGFGVFMLASFLTAALAFAFRQGPVQALATEMVPTHARGALVAMRNTASQIGIAVSTWASGKLYDRYGYAAVGIFCGLVSLAAALFIFMMKEPQVSAVEKSEAEPRTQAAKR